MSDAVDHNGELALRRPLHDVPEVKQGCQSGSVLAGKMNLECGYGHRYFSPQWMEWIGKECLAGAFMAASGAPR